MNKLTQKINKKPTLIEQLNDLPKTYFSLNDIQKISRLDYNSLKVSLSHLVKSGKIKRLTYGYYTLDLTNIDMVAFGLEYYTPSYVSFEWALGYYKILSQQPYATTLATTNRGKIVDIKGSALIYRHIQDKCFWGFVKKGNVLIADPEKAFLDQAYLSLNGAGVFDVEEMNLNILDNSKLKKYLKKFDDKRLYNLINNTVD